MSRFEAIFRLSLIRKFKIAAAITIVISMATLSYAVSHRFETIAMQAAAEEGALLVGAFLGPEVQELASRDTLAPETVQRLNERLRSKLGERVKVVKIWLRDGTLVYATNNRLVGQKFPSAHLEAAFAGQVSGSFDELDDPENQFERELNTPLIEIYAPFYRSGTSEVIAVGEIYNDGSRLAAELRGIRWTTATIVGAITAPMMVVLLLMARRAHTIVTENRQSLSRKVEEARRLALQNDQLRREADEARLDAIHSNERLLGQIGQDLHDGPIQLLSIMALRLPDLSHGTTAASDGSKTVMSITDLTTTALADLRDIAVGLVLPQLEGLTARETIQLAISRHESITGTRVQAEIGELSFYPKPSLRICLFRVVQEGLNNAYHYAGGKGQQVQAALDRDVISISVKDSGRSAASASAARPNKTGLGLPGLQRRVRGFRGTLDVVQTANGTEMRVRIPLNLDDAAVAEVTT